MAIQVLIVGTHKGSGDTNRRIYRTSATPSPRVPQGAASDDAGRKFQRPVMPSSIPPAAYPGIESEERGISKPSR
jgi:acetyl-CoA carboxylase alpha subunit